MLEGLKRLEYRGYDSCGIAVNRKGRLQRSRSTARVAELEKQVNIQSFSGALGIAHTRWATHGAPTTDNAHPHFSGERIALVHNGIIENHAVLREELQARGYTFASQTDTEVIAHLIDACYQGDLLQAVRSVTARLQGAFAIAVICNDDPQRLVGARKGSPLVVGIGQGDVDERGLDNLSGQCGGDAVVGYGTYGTGGCHALDSNGVEVLGADGIRVVEVEVGGDGGKGTHIVAGADGVEDEAAAQPLEERKVGVGFRRVGIDVLKPYAILVRLHEGVYFLPCDAHLGATRAHEGANGVLQLNLLQGQLLQLLIIL